MPNQELPVNMKGRLYVATIASDAVRVAEEWGIGIEIDEFCTASNMEGDEFERNDAIVKRKMKNSRQRILHGPFNELFPSAIDPEARALAYKRLEQAYALTARYGINRLVLHSGYLPHVYFKNWFLERSVEFWKTFMEGKPKDFHVMIENVLEEEPYTLASLIEKIGDKRVRACLDIGHAHCSSSIEISEWIKTLAPWASHVHIHNNFKEHDNHNPLGEGEIDMNAALQGLRDYGPQELTYTIENLECARSLTWLKKHGWI